MSRPMLVVFLLLLLIITSQFEWRQQLVSDIDANDSPKQQQQQQQLSKREEGVKEKIILSQEKNIEKLNEMVRSLREELQRCRSRNDNGTEQHE
ncbi:hypothetical protein M569_04255 [Genlisea aurea]|uniref:Uncharacterized protein n=1 Tax=Genlisea aurea TaxID=192259 RepID=S8CZJ3_9LAMI|nr:hypothetical protein M569_04255 [Genlisea aurea]